MEAIFFILALVWSVLCLILFFKLWGMTNDVAEIKKLLQSKNIQSTSTPISEDNSTVIDSAEPSSNILEERQETIADNKVVDDSFNYTLLFFGLVGMAVVIATIIMLISNS